MKIDRTNYETWFVDLLDGNLNETEMELLNIFLSENPDLREELNELDGFKLMPPEIKFSLKTNLNKSFSDISDNQYDYLCVAFMENDLSEEELSEFSEITSADPGRKSVLDLFRHIRLTPPDTIYKNKKKLFRITPLQRVIRLSVASLSAAATVSILVMSWLFISENDKDTSVSIPELVINEGRAVHAANPEEIRLTSLPDNSSVTNDTAYQQAAVNKITAVSESEISEEVSGKIQVSPQYEIIPATYIQPYKSIALLNSYVRHDELISPGFSIPRESEDRWVIGRYIAKTFRGKILKEETIDESPIRGYEIAEAGITGINKLFGWQMAFVKNSNDDGEVKSVYFSSKIIKIQAPVNKQMSAD